jgi:SAM-dependent methyltransferase
VLTIDEVETVNQKANGLVEGAKHDALEELGAKYQLLGYHVPYLREFAKVIDPRSKDVLEVGGAMPREIVLDHFGCNSWTATESPQYDEELGAANQQTRAGTENARKTEGTRRYRTLLKNVEEFDAAEHGQYDVIFSIACFEHISRFPEALEAMYRCLRPGGQLFSMFSPVWSSVEGHHLYHLSIPERFGAARVGGQILQPWEHLLKNRLTLYRDLEARFDRSFAAEVVYQVFNSPHINRYHTEDFVRFIADSPFTVRQMLGSFRMPMPEGYQNALERACPGYTQFDNQGIYLVLERGN